MFVKTPALLRALFPNFLWRVPTKQPVLYLTFDDGPIPQVTDFVLEELEKYQAKATFFCVGDNIRKHPEIFHRLLVYGHKVGNHTYNHLKGWKTSHQEYVENAALWEAEAGKIPEYARTNFFRPPYGRIKPAQARNLRKQGYKIVMWDVLTKDYDQQLSEKECLKNALKYTDTGSVIVFHDSLKAEKNLRYVLPRFLKHFSDKGFVFQSLDG
jgi:peptidoglycan-N-acetylglucosamine deacetylase